MHEISYIGNELELFSHAKIWKNYYGNLIRPYLTGKVLEVGAGIGSTTDHLCSGRQERWICLEPDTQLFEQLEKKISARQLPDCCEAIQGTTEDLPPGEKFNAIIYIDVIEHIEKDAEELDRAANLLEEGGHLIVLVPAHQFLYSPFDKAIGHYRRYSKKMLKAAGPQRLQLQSIKYLDSTGLMASMVNKIFLKQQYPTLRQIRFWDRVMVRLSRITDVFTAYNLGKTVVGIWKKTRLETRG
jgi:cyclopropane fatty-acyl-phospholipid synthase-like methyltransferase